MKVVMLGADRSVKGGVSAVVNNLYEAGLDQRIDLTYIGTMVDGSTVAKLLKGVQALLKFVAVLPKADIVHLNMAADASCYRKLIFMQIALWFHKKVVIHEHGGDFQGFYYKRCSAKRQAYIKKMLNRADLFLVLTDVWKDFSQTWWIGTKSMSCRMRSRFRKCRKQIIAAIRRSFWDGFVRKREWTSCWTV
ncbi:MAG: hypothetical protein ACLSCO_14525 [Gallintestinimicrobium sp.]